MQNRKTKEAQNQIQYDRYLEKGPAKMGPWTSHIWRTDPKHLGFLLARYKFCAKILSGKEKVLEVGCGDGFGTLVVLQTVGSIHGIDFEPLIVADANERFMQEDQKKCIFTVHDITKKPMHQKFDAVYSLDVLEHIPPEHEDRFMSNICDSLTQHSVCIIGTPNVTAQQYASSASAEGHVNLKSADSLTKLMNRYFHHVFIFSMNDEVVHTGFYPMAHYLLALGAGVKERGDRNEQ